MVATASTMSISLPRWLKSRRSSHCEYTKTSAYPSGITVMNVETASRIKTTTSVRCARSTVGIVTDSSMPNDAKNRISGQGVTQRSRPLSG